MKKDDFISSIGYDGPAAIVDRARKVKNAGKSLTTLLEEGSFRAATALALYNDSEEDLQTVADYYNKLAGSSYTATTIARVFGIAKVDVPKILFL
ncbi:hypothetical protein [Treponema phagedenis]|nr:hypothetical protein [Treponema phagedenis]EFW36824.1 hypothetical protein HMPREF9554_02715 [Treponema phagedenis F0421]NVP25450.1 hypothetical protein [Treponema phagedenis]QKS91292.1 hypothetical protein HPJ96_00960 [Treponema phagedenis]QLC57403.1 hypothetical protein HW453_00100 [Treponema phagedenis]CEM61091.1 conserved hypothetical protein [Treponema phagedenis]